MRIRVKGAGKSGEFTAVMVPKNSGGVLSAAGMRGGMLSAAGTRRGGTNWLNVAKKASAVASPLAMLSGPEMLPVSAGIAAFAGSGKKKKAGVSKKQGKKIQKGVDLAAQIGSIIAESQGYNKEAKVREAAGVFGPKYRATRAPHGPRSFYTVVGRARAICAYPGRSVGRSGRRTSPVGRCS